jgi:sterol desaturase/sphingolipid hydroxylase (fatty acid hydroxylase superfamily)
MKLELREDLHEVISHKDESIPLFDNKVLDYFSRVSWWIVPIIYLPVVIYFGYISIVEYQFTILNFALYFILGIGLWTIIEYFFHRFIFHYTPKSEIARKFFFTMHGVHHAFPADSKRLVLPPSVSIPLSSMFFVLFYYVFGGLYAPLFAGFMLGYLGYDMIHYATHHAHFIKFEWFKNLKQQHMKHHFQDPNMGFGVTSDLWDKIMHTEIK